MATASVLALLAMTSHLGGCTSETGGDAKPNQPPTVWLSSAPPSGTTSKYIVHLFWGGWDPDGEIAYYEYSITDNEDQVFNPQDTVGVDKWHRVNANDSVFTFTADVLVDSSTTELITEFNRSHTFFIRSVDRQGLVSVEPAHRSFTARTLSPTVNIEVPRRASLNPAMVPAITTFRWKATDYIDDLVTPQPAESVQFALVSAEDGFQETIDWLRANQESRDAWHPWVDYKAPGDSGKFWTSDVLEYGPYIFAIRAKDEAGAITPVLDEAHNVRRLRVSQRSTGPLMTVTNPYLGPVATTVCNTPVVILDIIAGVPMEFCWTADAETYGGLVTGYRYGWDIVDVNDPDQWEIDYTPFANRRQCSPPRTFYFGTHTFTVETMDNSGYCSRIEVKVNVVQFTMARNLVLIDDFSSDEQEMAGWNGPTLGLIPSDAEHDAFWNDVLGAIEGFDPDMDVLEVNNRTTIELTRIADYKSMVWNVYSNKSSTSFEDLPLLYQYILHRPRDATTAAVAGKRQPNLLSLYMAAGGHLLICGEHPLSNGINRSLAANVRFPFIPRYEAEGEQENQPDLERPPGEESYLYADLCVDVLDYSTLNPSERRNRELNCPAESQRTLSGNQLRDDTMREAFPLDPDFPLLRLRPEAAATGRAYDPGVRGIDVEVYNPAYFFESCEYTPSASRDCFEPIYGLGCQDSSEPTYHQPVAFWTSAFADRQADVPGAVQARSAVFGFPPVYFYPDDVREAVGHIIFDEWQLPRKIGN